MANLTEPEIIDCLITNFRLAAESSDALAKLPAKGPTYRRLREELKLCEGASRQLAYWREDARWLQIGLYMEECHKRAGGWLRTHQPARLFSMLAENLRAGLARAQDLKDSKTGKVGAILPKPQEGPHRDTKPVAVNNLPADMVTRPSGLIVPASAGAQ